MGRILIVDDERSIRLTLKAFLEKDGYQVETAEDEETAMAILHDREVDIVVSDIILPRVSGVQLLQRIRETCPEVLVIMMTGEPTLETASESLRLGAVDYLQKPVGKTDILKTVQSALRVKRLRDEKERLEKENLRYLEHLEELVAERTRNLTESEAKLRRQAEELAILSRLSSDVGASMTVDATIRAGMRHILKAANTDLAVVFLLEDDRLISRGLFTEGGEAKWRPEKAHRIGECLCGIAISEKQTIFCGNIHEDPRCSLKECKRAGLRSFSAITLQSGEEILGVLGLASLAERDFSTEQPFFEALASELAVGLKKSLLYENLQQRAEEIQENLSRIKQGEAERQQLELQLYRSQKMEAIGTLAGGIAHDFNNILSAVIGYTELAFPLTEGDQQLHLYLKEVLTASARAKDLVQQILAFSRQGEEISKPIALAPIVREVLKLLRASLPATIEISWELNSDLAVMGDPTKIHQVLMNLCANAAHAMRKKGGALQVKLADVLFGAEKAARVPDRSAGPHVILTVSDTGHGMSRHVMDRMYDPFYTTKRKGEGTGLGLSVVHGIVRSMNGAIDVTSVPGKGATFELFFPAIGREEETMIIEGSAPRTGSERVLVVDDEPMLVDIAKRMLQKLGYQVTTRMSPIEALELFRSRPQDFDVVITDLTMPQMTGDVLAKKLLNVRPDIPVILCTGFSASITEEKARAMGIKAFLMKPILMSQVAEIIRRVID